MLYALTINQKHRFYHDDISLVVADLFGHTDFTFIDIVSHSNDHYHALIDSRYPYDYLVGLRGAHIEPVRTPKAYITYMHNHDVTKSFTSGELPYYEVDNMIEYAIANGLVKTVEKYGMSALRQYKNLAMFLNDYNLERYKN